MRSEITADGKRRAISFLCGMLLAFACAAALLAQEPTPAPSASPKTRSVRFSFLPPPLEGTISLGIYDAQGKLVRVLQREASPTDFVVGHDALGATWDGKDDAGKELPPGKYRARGFAVGEIEVEGVGYFFNDWIDDENSPRITRITGIANDEKDELVVLAVLNGGKHEFLRLDPKGDIAHATEMVRGDLGVADIDPTTDLRDLLPPDKLRVRIVEGKLSVLRGEKWEPADWPGLIAPTAAALGKGDTIWVIDRADKDSEVPELKQFSGNGEFLRHLAPAPGEPPPKAVAASREEDQVCLLEENSETTRLRALFLAAQKNDGSGEVSDWKVRFQKAITAHSDFGLSGGKLVAHAPGKSPAENVKVKLQPNPLMADAAATVELRAGFDATGSWLQTADGLPLRAISQTPHIVRLLLAPHAGEKALDVYQDDAAVVEQFRIHAAEKMMAFDAGDLELK